MAGGNAASGGRSPTPPSWPISTSKFSAQTRVINIDINQMRAMCTANDPGAIDGGKGGGRSALIVAGAPRPCACPGNPVPRPPRRTRPSYRPLRPLVERAASNPARQSGLPAPPRGTSSPDRRGHRPHTCPTGSAGPAAPAEELADGRVHSIRQTIKRNRQFWP